MKSAVGKIRRAAVGVLVAAVGAAGYLAAPSARSASSSTVVAGFPSALVSVDGRTLSVSRTGPCLPAGALTVHESRSAVRVTLRTLPHFSGCTSAEESRTYIASLRSPLGTRAVVDAASGRQVPVFDGGDLLHPSTLPPGYVHVYDAAASYVPGSGDEDSGGWGAAAAASQLFADAAGDRLWLSQTYGEHWPDGWTAAETTVAVRHTLGRARTGLLAWREGGESFLVAGPSLSTPQLVAFANGLTPQAR